MEFDRMWETTSDLNEDDFEIMLEECKKQWADYPWKATRTRGAFVQCKIASVDRMNVD